MEARKRERGLVPPSEIFFHIPSDFARNALFSIVGTGRFYCNQLYNVERDYYPSHLLMLIKQGKMVFRHFDQEYTAEQNTLVFMDCLKPHMYRAEGDLVFEWVHFEGSGCHYYFEYIFEKKGCVHPLGDNPVIPQYMSHILEAARNGQINEHFVSLHLHHILAELSQISIQVTDSVREIIRHAIMYIETHFKQNINLSNLSNYAHLSPRHFSRVFKEIVGYTPHEYIINSRLGHAKSLLRTTTLSIEEIAIESGFNSASHFITTFKKRVNLTPQKFRDVQF